MATMNVNLTPELAKLVHGKVENGRYSSASEVIREALRLMEQRDELKDVYKEEMRRKIAAGMESARQGRLHDGEAFFDSLLAEHDGRTK